MRGCMFSAVRLFDERFKPVGFFVVFYAHPIVLSVNYYKIVKYILNEKHDKSQVPFGKKCVKRGKMVDKLLNIFYKGTYINTEAQAIRGENDGKGIVKM